jgi:hypothetical protein
MNGNKSHLAHERRRWRCVIGTILSAVALSAILSAAPAMAQAPAPPQHVAPAMQDVATPVQPLPVPPQEVLRHQSRDLDREALSRNENAPIIQIRQSAE